MKAVKVEVSGLAEGMKLRLTAVGGAALENGAVIKVPLALAQELCEQHPLHCKIPGKTMHSVPVEDVKDDFKYEIVKGEAKPAVKTDSPAKPSAAGVPSNKALLKGQVQEK